MGTCAAMASSAAVDDTVTKPAALSRAVDMAPVLKRNAFESTRPSSTSSAQRSG